MAKFQIFADSCCDLSKEVRAEAGLDYFRMNIVVAGEQKLADLDWDEYSPEELYAWIANTKNHCKTTLIPGNEFETKMRKCLEKGMDVLYIGCSGKLTGSMNVFNLVVSELQEEFPDRKMIGIDSLCASCSEGMLALKACALQKEGKSLEEVVEWVEAHRNFYNQAATVDTLTYLKEAGRVSGTGAFFGNIIGIKPIFISDAVGHNLVVEKAKGTKNSLKRLYEMTLDAITPETEVIFIGQGMAMDKAEMLKEKLEAATGIKCVISWIGPIVGITCGPGVIATFLYGKEVTVIGDDAKKQLKPNLKVIGNKTITFFVPARVVYISFRC